MIFVDKLKASDFFRANFVVGLSTVARIFTGLLKNKSSAVLLGPIGVGVLGLAGQMQLFLLSLGSLSIGSGFIQMLSQSLSEKNQEEKNILLKTMFTLLFCFNVVFLLLGLAALPFLGPISQKVGTTPANLLPVICAVPFGAFVASYLQCILFSHGRYELWSRANIIMAVFDLILFVSLSWLFGVQGALWATGISMVFLSVLCLYYCLQMEDAKNLFKFGFSKKVAQDLARFGGIGIITSTVTYSFGIFLRIYLVKKFGAELNGSYQAVCVISGFYSQLLTNGIWAQVFPVVSKSKDKEEINAVWSESISMISCMGALILSALLIQPDFLISMLFNKGFLLVISFFPLLILGDFFYLVAQPSLGVMLAKKSLAAYTYIWTAYFILLAGLSVLCGSIWGILGIGIAHLGTNLLLAVAALIYYFSFGPKEAKKTYAYLILITLLLATQFLLWESFGSANWLGLLLRVFCYGATVIVAALGIFHYSDSTMDKLSTKTHILNIFRSLFMQPLLEPLAQKLAIAGKDNKWIFRSLPNHYQYPKPSLRTATRNGIHYQLDIADFIDWHIYFGYSEGTKKPLYEMVKSGDIAIDVGANIGETSLELAKRVGPQGKVFSFEPDPIMRAKFEKNLSFNKGASVQVEPWALSYVPGTYRLYRISERNPAGNKIMAEGPGDYVNIEAMRLDDYVRDKGFERVNLIKIDVEGFEKNVLLGAEKTILKFKPKLFVEISVGQLLMQKTSAQEIFTMLEDWGYEIRYAHNSNIVGSRSTLESSHFDILAV